MDSQQDDILIHDKLSGIGQIFNLREMKAHMKDPKPILTFSFCQGQSKKLLTANLDGRGGTDLMCLELGSRKYEILHSLSLSTSLSVVKGNLGDFCESSQDILSAGGDFNGDGLSDLACRHINPQESSLMSLKFGVLN